MNRKKLNPSEGELLASAKDALKWKSFLTPEAEDVEKGFYTAMQICQMIGMKKSQTKALINRKLEEGECVMKSFRVRKNGKAFIIPHYKINIELDEDL
jgi:hypothetical protein